MRRLWLLSVPLLALSPTAAQAAAPNCSPAKATTYAYKTVPGVSRNLTSLDLYMPASSCRKGKKAPIVVWVHGGAYAIGDKYGSAMPVKARLFNSKGWALVSVNYRLTDVTKPNPWRWPTHFEDVSAAISWIKKNIASRGGDPSRIAALGHSAGADLVANIATEPTYLAKYGLSPKSLRCQGPLDTLGFNKLGSPDPDTRWWTNALGNAPDFKRTTSATLIARRGVGTPRAIVALRGSRAQIAISNAYIARLSQLGIGGNRAIKASGLTHNEIASQIGRPGDTVMTPPLVSFLASCFK